MRPSRGSPSRGKTSNLGRGGSRSSPGVGSGDEGGGPGRKIASKKVQIAQPGNGGSPSVTVNGTSADPRPKRGGVSATSNGARNRGSSSSRSRGQSQILRNTLVSNAARAPMALTKSFGNPSRPATAVASGQGSYQDRYQAVRSSLS